MPPNLISFCSSELGVSTSVVKRIASQSPFKYKRFFIKKRSGGLRDVAQPAREVKALQRAIVQFLSKQCPMHKAATAYIKGTSILKNAKAHVGASYILKLDFEDFFGSIKYNDVYQYLSDLCGTKVPREDIALAATAMTWRRSKNEELSLCIGAPSSPFISNALMFSFDKFVADECFLRDVIYTRYSDDLTFSSISRQALLDIEVVIRDYISKSSLPRLKINLIPHITHPTLRADNSAVASAPRRR